MRYTIWSLFLFATLSIAISVVAFVSRREVLNSRDAARADLDARARNRARADRIEASWDPSHPIPMDEDVFGDVPDDLVRVTPADPSIAPLVASRENESTRIQVSWTSARAVHALLDRRFDGCQPDAAARVAAEFQTLAMAIPPVE